MCPYDEVILSEGATICVGLPDNQYLLNPFDMKATSCDQEVLGDFEQKKLSFLCAEAP